jgi:hypothetical protein
MMMIMIIIMMTMIMVIMMLVSISMPIRVVREAVVAMGLEEELRRRLAKRPGEGAGGAHKQALMHRYGVISIIRIVLAWPLIVHTIMHTK